MRGCSVSATTTSVIDDTCPTLVAVAPDDVQGEDGSHPSGNQTCPVYPGIEVSVLDDQGQNGLEKNDTCPVLNGTASTFDDDQGSEGSKSCKLNGTVAGGATCPANGILIQGPDGVQDGERNSSCPMQNVTIPYEPDGALEGESPSCSNSTGGFNLTAEQDEGQGEDGVFNQTCMLGANLTVDNDQGENGIRPNTSVCLSLDSSGVISPLDDQGDDWVPPGVSPQTPVTVDQSL